MVTSSLVKSLLLLAVGFTHQAGAVCTASVTAQQGDTCATIAAEAGITVSQFLKSNPGITSCSALVAGASYCVQGTADGSAPTQSSSSSASPASSPSSSPTGVTVSTDGTCGSGITCAGSTFGSCCSAHGFCGSTDAYCGTGCQAGFGSCGSGAGTTSGGGGGTTPVQTQTVTVTTITAITRTSLVYQTSTVTDITTQTKTAAAVTSTATVTLTTVKTSTSTAVTTKTVGATSVSIETITTIVTSTFVLTSAGCNTSPTSTTGVTTTPVVPPSGYPTLPGTPKYCQQFDVIQSGDTCRSIADRNGLTLLQFYKLNPSVSADPLITLCTGDILQLLLSGLCQISCDSLWPGYYVCVGR